LKVVKVLAYIVIALFLVVAMAPKKNLYFLAEEELLKYKIVLSGESIHDGLLSLEVRDADIFYEDIYAGKLESLQIYPLIFWNQISLENLTIDNALSRFVPQKSEHLLARYSFLNPVAIKLQGDGSFGSFSGEVNIIDRNISIDLNASKEMQKYTDITKKMKKIDGKLRYEQNF